jgi:thiol:disulfide interchange protein
VITPSQVQLRLVLVAMGLVVLGIALWVAWPLIPGPAGNAVPLAGLASIATGWVLYGVALRPGGRPLRGALLGVALYVGLGVVWLLAWNVRLRVSYAFELPAMTDPVPIIATVLTWPWQLFVWLAAAASA